MLKEGDIVIFRFPFSDLSTSKIRPALVLKILNGQDAIVCMLTTQDARCTGNAIPVGQADIEHGSLRKPSNIRPDRLFTANTSIFVKTIATVNRPKIQEVYTFLHRIFS
jgi:mRNA interferase MazF